MQTPSVYLIGAGPGDLDLLTLKAIKTLARCDVWLIDDLVNRELLAQASPVTRIIPVGKRGGCKSTPQAFIIRQMIRYARQGHCVARIKGGDPFVFGRGGEEMLALRQAEIACEIIPGITAGLAAPAALGIPATFRGRCDGVTFLTGHTGDGRQPNWAALAQAHTTLVIYMGMHHLETITQGLLAGGMSPATPAAVIQNGTLTEQRHLITTLTDLRSATRAAGLGAPAILVIGQVVDLAALTNQTVRLFCAA